MSVWSTASMISPQDRTGVSVAPAKVAIHYDASVSTTLGESDSFNKKHSKLRFELELASLASLHYIPPALGHLQSPGPKRRI